MHPVKPPQSSSPAIPKPPPPQTPDLDRPSAPRTAHPLTHPHPLHCCHAQTQWSGVSPAQAPRSSPPLSTSDRMLERQPPTSPAPTSLFSAIFARRRSTLYAIFAPRHHAHLTPITHFLAEIDAASPQHGRTVIFWGAFFSAILSFSYIPSILFSTPFFSFFRSCVLMLLAFFFVFFAALISL